MRRPVELYFSTGQNKKVAQELLLEVGELALLVNADLSSLGVIKPAKSLVTQKTFASNIHSLLTYPGGKAWVGEGANLKEWDSATNIFTTLVAARALGVDYNGWMFVCNGTDKKTFDIALPTTQAFEWGVTPPAVAPTVAPGAAGNPDGTYDCYFSYVAKHTDGSEYETDLSPVGSVTVASEKIEWSVMVASADPQVTHKRLYRTVGGTIQYVTEITNATTTYSDDATDATLTSNEMFDRTGYYPPPASAWMAVQHYRRIFLLVNGAYSHYLYWSEAEEPRGFVYNTSTGLYTNSTDVFTKGDPCMGMVGFGEHLFIASRDTFKALTGSDPSYWSLHPTLAAKGNVAKYAMQKTPFGILHVWWDGVHLFNGYNSTRISGKNTPFFDRVNWDYADTIFSSWDGIKYRLWVPYDGATTPNRCFVIDFETYPRIRFYETSLGEDLALWDSVGRRLWIADGANLKLATGIDVVAFDAWSKTFATARLIGIEGADRLNYEANTDGDDLTVTFYFDHVAHATTQTINTLSRERGWVSIPQVKARTMSIRLSGNLSNNATIYEPWILGDQ